jgi:hypothetical protein
MTERARSQRLEAPPRGCDQLLPPHQRLCRLYLPICHDHRPHNQELEILLGANPSTPACHTRLLAETLAYPYLLGYRNHHLDNDSQTLKEREGGIPFHQQIHITRKLEGAVCEVRGSEPVAEVLEGSIRSLVHLCEGEEPKVEVHLFEGDGLKVEVHSGTEEESFQMIADVWMIGRSLTLEMVDVLLRTTPGKLGAPLVREA